MHRLIGQGQTSNRSEIGTLRLFLFLTSGQLERDPLTIWSHEDTLPLVSNSRDKKTEKKIFSI